MEALIKRMKGTWATPFMVGALAGSFMFYL